MALCSTETLLNEFCESTGNRNHQHIKDWVLCDALKDYEKKVGKQAVEMDRDELIGMIQAILEEAKGINNVQLTSRYKQIAWLLRNAFDYYSEHYERVYNPMRNTSMTREALDIIVGPEKKVDREYMESIINKLYSNLPTDRAKYYELVMRLFYCGFANGEEIATFKERNINFKKRTIFVGDHFVQLSDECFSLLVELHGLKYMSGPRKKEYNFIPYNGSYFKFPTTAEEAEFNDYNMSYVRNSIHQFLTKNVLNAVGETMKFTELYYLGFYDHLVDVFGREKANKMIKTRGGKGNNPLIEALMTEAQKYGYTNRVTDLRQALRSFVIE